MSDPNSDLNRRSLEAFPSWLRTLQADVRLLTRVIEDTESGDAVREALAAALNYLFKSVDLIADGIEDLGYMDDAFVLRVAASAIDLEAVNDAAQRAELERLAADAELIREFMGADYARLETYVSGLGSLVVCGRSAADIARDPEVRQAFLGELSGWAGQYVTPSFEHDEKNLVKLRAFLGTKLAG
ncbi:MAG TPA: YkvA family protein [Polyangiaceae bacterium]|nr:YkvA family protein [Polyangiaceae bacterium]